MRKNATVRARVEPELKAKAEAALDALGLNPTTAITLFYRQVVLYNGLPFEVRIPNATTRRAMRDAMGGSHLIRGDSMDALLAKLDENRGVGHAERPGGLGSPHRRRTTKVSRRGR